MKVIKIHEDEGIRCGLQVSEGPKFISVIWIDSAGMRIRKLAKERSLRIVELVDYPIARAKKILRGCGNKFGITKAAKRALRA